MVDRFAGFLPEVRGDFTYAPCRFFFAGFNDGLFFKTRQFLFLFPVMASTYLQGLAGFVLRADSMIDQMPRSGQSLGGAYHFLSSLLSVLRYPGLLVMLYFKH